MEGHRQLDASRRATTAIAIVLLALFLFPAAGVAKQNPQQNLPSVATIEQLYNAGRYEEIVALVPAAEDTPAELDLYRGLALARLQRWKEAEEAFAAGHRKEPANPRFFVELAGAEYKLKDFRAAKANLHRAMRIHPADSYSREFLGTIYFVEGNLDAALQEWNHIGKPEITAINNLPEPRVKNDILQKAFAVSPLSVLQLKELRTTRARLDNLGIFPRYRFELVPTEPSEPNTTDSYALEFHSTERNGWGTNWKDGLLRMFSGLVDLTVYPQDYNMGHSARNLDSLFRWDDNKRRVYASFTEPLGGDPRWRLEMHGDARNENWNISQTFLGATQPLLDLNLEKIEAGAQLRAVESGRWSWDAGLSYAYRRFRNATGIASAAAPFFANSGSLEYRADVKYELLYLPEKRFTLDSAASGSFGKNFARGLGAIGSSEGSLTMHWYPKASGSDYETTLRMRAGGEFGQETLDQLYQLGIERENALTLHGVPGSRGGRKGTAPLGRQFVLWNLESNKNIYNNGLIAIQLGPLLDAGRIADSSGYFGSSGWLWDPGGALRVRVPGSVGAIVSYARDMPTHSHTFYITLTR
jgi:tetratricopeptide (TPR) repeat protein